MMLHTGWKKWGEEWIDQLCKFKEVKRKFKTKPSHMCPKENRLGILTLRVGPSGDATPSVHEAYVLRHYNWSLKMLK